MTFFRSFLAFSSFDHSTIFVVLLWCQSRFRRRPRGYRNGRGSNAIFSEKAASLPRMKINRTTMRFRRPKEAWLLLHHFGITNHRFGRITAISHQAKITTFSGIEDEEVE